MDSGAWRRGYSAGDSVVAIINPITRINDMQVRAVLGQWLPEGVSLRIYETRKGVPTSELANEVIEDDDGVIACGGDGTVSEVAAAIGPRRIPLGIIPSGSTNIIAQEMGVPNNISAAAALAFGPFDVHEMDIGTCNDHHFLHMAGTGLDSRMFEATDRNLKRRIGWGAYVPAAIRALRERGSSFHITIDDEEHSVVSPLVLVANGSSIINASFRIDESIVSDDGKLDVIIVTANRPHELAMLIAHAANPMATLSDSPWVIQRTARKIEIESEYPQPIQLDGDVVEETPATIGILPSAIGIAVPSVRR